MKNIIIAVLAIAPFVTYCVGLKFGIQLGYSRGSSDALTMVTNDLNDLAERAQMILDNDKRSEEVLYS